MAYVRKHGNQLAIVHGDREPGTGKVQQRVLRPIYSKKEALDIIGEGRDGADAHFRFLLEDGYPGVTFPWKKIHKAIRENLHLLPDTYDYPQARLRGKFRQDLCAFFKQLTLADPQALTSADEVVQEHIRELAWIADLIKRRLARRGAKKGEWSADNEYGWRYALRGHGVPPEMEEEVAELYEKGDYDRAEVRFRLLVDAFEDYAEGHNYLGLIALERGKVEEAIGRFEKTVEVGRRLFPKRIAKKSYWSDISTRPYMRGLQNLASALERAGRHEEALAVTERLGGECGDDVKAAYQRSSIHLNCGRWEEAAKAAIGLREVYPSQSILGALALFELGRLAEATASFLHGVLNHPRAARMLLGERTDKPSTYEDVEDHNEGVYLSRALKGFLAKQGRGSREFFCRLLKGPSVAALERELAETERKWGEVRMTGAREPFQRMMEMRTPKFAESEAAKLADSSMMLIDRGGSHGKNGKVQR